MGTSGHDLRNVLGCAELGSRKLKEDVQVVYAVLCIMLDPGLDHRSSYG